MSDEAIRIECPGCHTRFRLRKRPSSPKAAVRCTKCSAKIPLPPPHPNRASGGEQAPDLPATSTATDSASGRTKRSKSKRKSKASDAKLREMLLRAKRERSTAGRGDDEEPPTLPGEDSVDDTQPEIGARTMPMGQNARTAEELGTDRPGPAPERPRPIQQRKRVDTPRAGAQMNAQPGERPKLPRKRRSRPEPGMPPTPAVDEPTYTGPVPGRTPKITPTEDDLARFLQPGHYKVRVEDVVYAPVNEEVLAKLVDSGTIVALDEICDDDGSWFEIVAGAPLQGVKERLAHRAHHILARVATGHPASEFERPPLPEAAEAAGLPETPQDSAITTEVAAGEPPDDTVEEAPEIDEPAAPTPKPKRGRRALLVIFALFTFAGLAFAAVALLHPGTMDELATVATPPEEAEDSSEPAPPPPIPVEEPDAGPPDPRPAYNAAQATVDSARAVADTIDGLLVHALEFGNDEAVTTLSWMKWRRRPASVDADDLIDRLMKRKDWSEARQVANWLIATRGETDELQELVSSTLQKQFAEQTPVEITTARFKRIARIVHGQRPALILEDGDGGRWTVWPNLGDDAWRGDIAVYRLCQAMVCHFSIPETRAMEIDKKTFGKLARASEEPVKEMASKLRSDFAWSEAHVLTGSIRRVPEGVRWPIEATSIWRPWLTAGSGQKKLDEDVEEAHHAVSFFGAAELYPELKSTSARQLARQVSTMLVIDYLTGNWNRFAPTEDNWGSRTLIQKGLLISVDDSAAFLGNGSVRVKGRFSWTSRFSRAAIESLDRLDPDVIGPLLFDDASKDEKKKLERLWSQRRRVLRRINKLVKDYGAEDVYALDPAPPESARGER